MTPPLRRLPALVFLLPVRVRLRNLLTELVLRSCQRLKEGLNSDSLFETDTLFTHDLRVADRMPRLPLAQWRFS